MRSHHQIEERSIALHRAVAEALRRDPALVDRARERARTWQKSGAVHSEYALAWQELLALPLEQLCAELVNPGERARMLRQVSPFAGVLAPKERAAIYWSFHSTSAPPLEFRQKVTGVHGCCASSRANLILGLQAPELGTQLVALSMQPPQVECEGLGFLGPPSDTGVDGCWRP